MVKQIHFQSDCFWLKQIILKFFLILRSAEIHHQELPTLYFNFSASFKPDVLLEFKIKFLNDF